MTIENTDTVVHYNFNVYDRNVTDSKNGITNNSEYSPNNVVSITDREDDILILELVEFAKKNKIVDCRQKK